MKFDLETLFIEEGCRTSTLATRILARLPTHVETHYIADGRTAALRSDASIDPFGAGKRRMILMQRRGNFLMGCPAGSTQFACCGYLVMILASNCPMDCSYCFLQEYVADNPGLQIYANYFEVFAELDRLRSGSRERALRIGTGELADSLAFDTLTGISLDLIKYFATRENLLLELKTKTDEIDNLLTIDPRGRTLVSWTLSSHAVFQSSEHRTASPAARIDAAGRVLAAGYKVAFHLDPLIVYPQAEHDYARLLDNLFDRIPPDQIAFVSLGGLRMTPGLRAIARERFPRDRMLLGEEVLAPDGRYRTFAPLRFRLYTKLREQITRVNPRLPIYLCMEGASVHQRVFGGAPAAPSALGARLAGA
jgi:spore photoproduct lyase